MNFDEFIAFKNRRPGGTDFLRTLVAKEPVKVPPYLERQAERHFYSLAEKIGIKIAIRTVDDGIWCCRLPDDAESVTGEATP